MVFSTSLALQQPGISAAKLHASGNPAQCCGRNIRLSHHLVIGVALQQKFRGIAALRHILDLLGSTQIHEQRLHILRVINIGNKLKQPLYPFLLVDLLQNKPPPFHTIPIFPSGSDTARHYKSLRDCVEYLHYTLVH